MKSKMDSKTKIRKAALTLFVKKGISGTRTREIAKKAGIGEGTIYRHFKSKDDLASKLFISHMNFFRETLSDSVRYHTNPREQLSALIKLFFHYAKEYPEPYAYIMMRHHIDLKKMPKETDKPKDIFVYVIREGINQGQFNRIDENLGAAFVIGMITRTILFFNNGYIKSDYKKIIQEVIKAVFQVLDKKS